MNYVQGELMAIFKDETRRTLFFKGYINYDENGMSDVEVQTIFDGADEYIEMDKLEGFEILGYRAEEDTNY